MKKLKILYHHRVAAQDGQSVHIHELTESFKELGHELIFVGPSLRPKEFGGENILLSAVRKFLPQFAQELLELAYSYRAYRKLYAAWKEHQPDILYERYNLFLSAGAKLKKKTGIPYLVEINAPLSAERAKYSGLSLRKLAEHLERKTWCAADMAFPVTRVLGNMLEEAGVPPEAITVLHNGINYRDYKAVDKSLIRQKLRLEGKLVLGFTGFLREWHKLDQIIRMIAKFRPKESPHLLVVGNGPAVEGCEQLAAELGITDRVHFAGFVHRADIPPYLMAMDIALQPAVTDYASPLKLFEYMVAGIAIVAPDQPNIREIVSHGSDALLFNPQAPTGAEAAIEELIKDKSLRERLGSAAQKSVAAKGFTWLANAEKITKIAQKLISGKTHSR